MLYERFVLRHDEAQTPKFSYKAAHFFGISCLRKVQRAVPPACSSLCVANHTSRIIYFSWLISPYYTLIKSSNWVGTPPRSAANCSTLGISFDSRVLQAGDTTEKIEFHSFNPFTFKIHHHLSWFIHSSWIFYAKNGTIWNPNGKHPNNSSVFIVAVASRSMAAGATCGKKKSWFPGLPKVSRNPLWMEVFICFNQTIQ